MNIFKLISDEIFPENLTCNLCGTEVFGGEALCADCAKTVTFNNGATCPKCGRKTNMPALCLECKANAPLYERAFSAFVYADGGKNLIYAFKNGKPWLSRYFSDLLSPLCKKIKDADAICYVPMTGRARRKRGYNQARLLAAELSKKLNLPLLDKAVKKIKKSKPQKSLTRKEREENLKGCFSADRAAVKDKNIILVDDVLTTGATADVITKELKRKGARKVYLITAASVEYKNSIL